MNLPCANGYLEDVIEFAEICRENGVEYVGVQTTVDGYSHESLVLFNEPGGSTLGIPVGEFSVEALVEKIKKHQEKARAGTPA